MADKETARDKEIRLRRYSERKTILTLDLGGRTGFACAKNGKYYNSNYSSVAKHKNLGVRYFNFLNELGSIIKIYDPAYIAYEKVERHAGTYAAHAYGAYQGIILAIAYDLGIPVVTMSVGEIKKFITGKGNADKQMVIDAVNKLGHNITDDNEADAVAMMYLQLSLMEK